MTACRWNLDSLNTVVCGHTGYLPLQCNCCLHRYYVIFICTNNTSISHVSCTLHFPILLPHIKVPVPQINVVSTYRKTPYIIHRQLLAHSAVLCELLLGRKSRTLRSTSRADSEAWIRRRERMSKTHQVFLEKYVLATSMFVYLCVSVRVYFLLVHIKKNILSAFEKSRNATISFVMSVCPSIRMQPLATHRTGF